MNKRQQAITDKQQPQKRPIPRRAAVPPAYGQAELSEELLQAMKDKSLAGQTAHLGDPRLQTAQRQALAAHMGRIQGNRQLQRFMPSSRPGICPTCGRQGTGRCPGCGQQFRPPASLAATPANAITPLPVAVQTDHAQRLAANDLDGALQVVVQAMEGRGEIDSNLTAAPAAAQQGAAVCASATSYSVEPSLGASALTTSCGCSGPVGNRIPNVRVQFGPGALRRIETLHSTILHEFRHVRQIHEECNRPGNSAVGSGGVCTDCNSPEEMDAYLAEVEAGYDPPSLRRAWVRVYTNWPYLALRQQLVFLARKTAAEQKINNQFPNVNWDADPQVILYSNWCQRLNTQLGGNTQGTCDNPIAPLNGPIPNFDENRPKPPAGDFPEPTEEEQLA